jgi:hypothetical protein
MSSFAIGYPAGSFTESVPTKRSTVCPHQRLADQAFLETSDLFAVAGPMKHGEMVAVRAML